MKIKRILVAGMSVLMLVGGAAGVALASGDAGGGKPATIGADAGNIQQGDQTTPDVSGTSNENAGGDATGADADNIQQGDQTTPDVAGTSNENASENSSESDGPGGHRDPPGDVDHQFEGSE